MKKILVAVDGKRGAWEALAHACSLAKRIAVELNILLVIAPHSRNLSHTEKDVEEQIKIKLGLLIEEAKLAGIEINYFITEGIYEDEVIHFVKHNNISLLVHGANDGNPRAANRDLTFLRSLSHRIPCMVEVVSQKIKQIT